MSANNNINLVGRITREPELKKTNTGKSVITFTLAVDRFGKGKKTDFINCDAWERTAEIVGDYCHKGEMLGVNGTLQIDVRENQDGLKKSYAKVVVSDVMLIGSRSMANSPYQSETFASGSEGVSIGSEDSDDDSLADKYINPDSLPF